MLTRYIFLLVVLVGCGREPDLAPARGAHLAPWRHLVDEVPGAERHPAAAVGEVTRYVLAELPAAERAGRVVARDGADAELVVDCPPDLAGRPVGLRLARLLAPQNESIATAVDAAPYVKCPTETGRSAAVPLPGVRADGMNGSVIPLVATAEPVPRVETGWLRIPRGAVLEVAFGMANPVKARRLPAARFEVRAEGRDGSSVRLLGSTVEAQEVAGQQWVTERIALGREVEDIGPESRLVFETSVAERDRPAFPVWGDPTVLVPAPPPPIERRNVVLISLDTMRADRLGTYGALVDNTPALDRLASEGTLFETALAAAPWTGPSHATLLTGFHGCVHRVGLYDHGRLPEGISPLPELLRQAGYTTAAFTEGGYMRAVTFQRGFGSYSAPAGSFAKRPWGNIDQTVDDASRWLREAAREPFFLLVHTYQVHSPYNAPPPYGDLLRPRDGGELSSRTLAVHSRVEMAKYEEEVRYTDSVMARLFATLDELRLGPRTIVVVVADHGEAFGEHGIFQHVMSLDEEVVRVPYIWFAPGLIAAGRRIPSVVGLVDVTPTLLELLEVKKPAFIQGLGLVRFLRDLDPPIAQAAQRFVFVERMLGDTPYPVLARGRWWRAPFNPTGAQNVELIFGEGLAPPNALATAAWSVADAARRLYEDQCARVPKLLPPERVRPAPVLPDPEHDQRLRALGYIE